MQTKLSDQNESPKKGNGTNRNTTAHVTEFVGRAGDTYHKVHNKQNIFCILFYDQKDRLMEILRNYNVKQARQFFPYIVHNINK